MSTRYTESEWKVWLEEYRQSGLSVKEFSELIEVSVATFYNWRRKLRQSADAGVASIATPVHFVEAFLPPSVVSDHIEIRLSAGASISAPNEVSSLKPILQTLAEIGANS